MIPLFKKFFLLFSSKSQNTYMETEIDLLKKEIYRLQEDQKVLVVFCKDSLLGKIKQIDTLQKNIVLLDNQIVKVNEIINQHADAINALIENYKKHIMNPYAHDNDGPEIENKGKKQRNDN